MRNRQRISTHMRTRTNIWKTMHTQHTNTNAHAQHNHPPHANAAYIGVSQHIWFRARSVNTDEHQLLTVAHANGIGLEVPLRKANEYARKLYTPKLHAQLHMPRRALDNPPTNSASPTRAQHANAPNRVTISQRITLARGAAPTHTTS